jgi:7-cyano-7-deazaguanine synthase
LSQLEPVNFPIHPHPALVLLSGGFDSTAALWWADWRHPEVRAITFDYGQPMRDAEDCAAGRAAAAFSVPWDRVVMADSLRPLVGRAGLLGGVEDHDDAATINPAFVPGRNLVFLALAAAHAMSYWPDAATLELVIGCCREDAGGFPDCSDAFIRSAEHTLSLAAGGRKIGVSAPWIKMPKARIWETVDACHWPLLEQTWSCYRGGAEPCGTCTACVLRARAFAGHTDRSTPAVMCGGDVHRERMIG